MIALLAWVLLQQPVGEAASVRVFGKWLATSSVRPSGVTAAATGSRTTFTRAISLYLAPGDSPGAECWDCLQEPALELFVVLNQTEEGGAMKTIRHIGSLAFVLGLFVAVFAGIPWAVIAAEDPVVLQGVAHSEAFFLQKPFSLDGLSRKVRDVLDGTVAARPDRSLRFAAI